MVPMFPFYECFLIWKFTWIADNTKNLNLRSSYIENIRAKHKFLQSMKAHATKFRTNTYKIV